MTCHLREVGTFLQMTDLSGLLTQTQNWALTSSVRPLCVSNIVLPSMNSGSAHRTTWFFCRGRLRLSRNSHCACFSIQTMSHSNINMPGTAFYTWIESTRSHITSAWRLAEAGRRYQTSMSPSGPQTHIRSPVALLRLAGWDAALHVCCFLLDCMDSSDSPAAACFCCGSVMSLGFIVTCVWEKSIDKIKRR